MFSDSGVNKDMKEASTLRKLEISERKYRTIFGFIEQHWAILGDILGDIR